jgi:hypothetical protein
LCRYHTLSCHCCNWNWCYPIAVTRLCYSKRNRSNCIFCIVHVINNL